MAAEQSAIRYIGPGDMSQEQVNSELTDLLAELGIDQAHMSDVMEAVHAERLAHHPVDYDSWLAGWFDALDFMRCSS